MQIYPAPSELQVRPSLIDPACFSLYWAIPGTNLGIPVQNVLTQPTYPTEDEAIASTVRWHGKQFFRGAKPVVRVNIPLENVLVRVSK